MRQAIIAVLVVLIAPAVALAQAATPSTAGQVVATAPPNSQVAQTEDVSDPDADQNQNGSKPHRISGEVSVGVGTGGYREVDGEASAPIGDTGQISIAVGDGQIGSGRR